MTTNPAAPDLHSRHFPGGLRSSRGRLLAGATLALFALAGFLFYPHARGLYHARAAQRAIDRWEFDEARTHLAVCLEVWPDSASTRFLAARTARRAGRLDEAEKHLMQFQARHGTSQKTAVEWALLRVERGEMGEAEEYLRTTIGPNDPDAAIVLEGLARGFLLTDRLTDLLEGTDLWLQIKPHDTHALYWRGLAHERLGDGPPALAAYREAVEADPDNIEARLRLADLLLTRGLQAEEALDHFERARVQRPGDPAVMLGLALCHKELGHTAQARELLDAFLVAHPDNPRAIAERGRLALDEGDTAHAETWLRRAVALAPDDREVLHSLILALRARDHQEEANDLERRLKQLTADLTRYDQLIKTVAREPQNVALRTEAGQICLRYGRRNEGRRWLASALSIDPQYAPARAALEADKGPPSAKGREGPP